MLEKDHSKTKSGLKIHDFTNEIYSFPQKDFEIMLNNINAGRERKDNAQNIIQLIDKIHNQLEELKMGEAKKELDKILIEITKQKDYRKQLSTLLSKLENVDEHTIKKFTEYLIIKLPPQLELNTIFGWQALQLEGCPDLPEPRYWHTQVYDEERNTLTIFGGKKPRWSDYEPLVFFGDTWQADLNEMKWFKREQSSIQPSPRSGAVSILDPSNNRILLYGGCDDSTFFNDLWEFNLISYQWTKLNPVGLGFGRAFASIVFDDYAKRLILFGGCGYLDGIFRSFNDTLALGLERLEWQALQISGTPPSKRSCHRAICDEMRRMIVYGGYDIDEYSLIDDLWQLDLQYLEWREIENTWPKPGNRAGMAMIFDSVSNRQLLIFGGIHKSGSLFYLKNDTWIFDFVRNKWQELPRPNPPSGRVGVEGSFDSKKSRIFIFGGKGGGNEIYRLKLRF